MKLFDWNNNPNLRQSNKRDPGQDGKVILLEKKGKFPLDDVMCISLFIQSLIHITKIVVISSNKGQINHKADKTKGPTKAKMRKKGPTKNMRAFIRPWS